MFLIDEPYVSDLLIRFLVSSQTPVLANAFAKASLPLEANLVDDDEAERIIRQDGGRWVYTSSENALGWLVERFGHDYPLVQKIELFKDKNLFREKTAALFPDILFRRIAASDIATLTFEEIGRPFIIKPNVGFISAGVFRVDTAADWKRVQMQICRATDAAARAFPGIVLRGDAFLIESVIEGEEFAVDAYYDERNQPVVLDILHHRFGSADDMSDRLYVTSAAIIREHLAKVEAFLHKLAGLGDFSGIPVHVELRIDAEGTVRPIEVNPLRFAGWCVTDIASYAHGVDVYSAFAGHLRPDWNAILAGREEIAVGMTVVGRESVVAPEQRFDYAAYAENFSRLFLLRKIDYRVYPIYAFLFFGVTPGNEVEFEKALRLVPSEYLV